MAERRNESMVEWLDINVDQLSPDDKMQLIQELMATLTIRELVDILSLADDMRKGRTEEAKSMVIESVRGELEELGLKIEDVFPPARQRKSSPVSVKYRSPDGQTWSGRGFKPVWARKLEEEGHDIEEFRVEKE